MRSCLKFVGLMSVMAVMMMGSVAWGVDHSASIAARKKVNALKGEQAKCEAAVRAIVQKLDAVFRGTAEWKAAEAEYKQAQAEYDAITKTILEMVRKCTEYCAAKADKESAQKHMESLRSMGGSTPELVAAAAAEVMGIGTTMTAMETKALEAEPRYPPAKERLAAATARLAALKAAFDESCKSDPNWQGARKVADAARDKLRQADQELTVACRNEEVQERAERPSVVIGLGGIGSSGSVGGGVSSSGGSCPTTPVKRG
jgi:hypothetical protein